MNRVRPCLRPVWTVTSLVRGQSVTKEGGGADELRISPNRKDRVVFSNCSCRSAPATFVCPDKALAVSISQNFTGRSPSPLPTIPQLAATPTIIPPALHPLSYSLGCLLWSSCSLRFRQIPFRSPTLGLADISRLTANGHQVRPTHFCKNPCSKPTDCLAFLSILYQCA